MCLSTVKRTITLRRPRKVYKIMRRTYGELITYFAELPEAEMLSKPASEAQAGDSEYRNHPVLVAEDQQSYPTGYHCYTNRKQAKRFWPHREIWSYIIPAGTTVTLGVEYRTVHHYWHRASLNVIVTPVLSRG